MRDSSFQQSLQIWSMDSSDVKLTNEKQKFNLKRITVHLVSQYYSLVLSVQKIDKGNQGCVIYMTDRDKHRFLDLTF